MDGLLAPLEPAALDRGSAAQGRHPLSKAVGLDPLSFVRLEGPFWHG